MASTIRFQCPSCRSQRLVSSSLVGRRELCPDCGESVEVSAEVADDADSTPQDPAPAEADDDIVLLGAETSLQTDENVEQLDVPMYDGDEPPIDFDDYSDDDEPPGDDAISFSVPQRAGEAEMDMTPMVDITFLLLTFFIVTAAFSIQRSFAVPPQKQNDPSTNARTMEDFEDDTDYVIVRVDAYNTYHVFAAVLEEEVEVPSRHELLNKLREARRGNSNGDKPTRMLVIAHGDAVIDKVITAFDLGTEVGMEEIKLVNVEEEKE